MDFTGELLHRLLIAVGQLFLQPFYYIGILFIVLQYRRQITLERKLFHTRLHSLLDETARSLLFGLLGGLAASIVMAVVGVTISLSTVAILWVIAMIAALFRLRFICFAYAVGLLGVLHAVFNWFPDWRGGGGIARLADTIAELNMPSLLALVAVLHVVEALLVRRQGTRTALPLFFEGKRGKIVGGYQLYGFWATPLFLIVPLEGGASGLPWTPFFHEGMWSGGWTIVAFPLVIGFAEMTVTKLPQLKVKATSAQLLLYGCALFGLAVLAKVWSPFIVAASLLCVVLHEAIIWYSSWLESQRPPYYVNDERGLMILGIVPKQPADQLGLLPGEIIQRVNGVKVRNKKDLHAALQANGAFCKLEVINLEGQVKFLQRALFADEHHQLGIILAPDHAAMQYVSIRQTGLIAYIQSKVRVMRNSA